ncbi:MAG: penicillin-binding protein, partial [Acidobacteria bacterium]|nr:penicillin-binding protein [Acidobacteriota bacterium]
MGRRRWIPVVVIALALLGDGFSSVLVPSFSLEAAAAPQKKKRSTRRRRPLYRVPNYTNPTKNDQLEGEELSVRAIAAGALGRLNGSVVVVDADTGRVLTVVNQKLAFSSGFKPCSTIKMAVSLGALAEGLITADTLVRVSRYKSMNLVEALAYSDNPFFENLGKQMGFEKVSAYARLLGFGELAGYLIEDEYPGSFPTRPPRNGGVARMSSYGEEIKVTPLQLAALMAAFANGGRLLYLQYPGNGEEMENFTPRTKRHLPIQRWLPELRAGMEAAVLYGTARVSAEAEERILGKTGTCSDEGAKLGWFASYGVLPTGQKVAVVVLLRGGSIMMGGKAAEVAAEVYH